MKKDINHSINFEKSYTYNIFLFLAFSYLAYNFLYKFYYDEKLKYMTGFLFAIFAIFLLRRIVLKIVGKL
jgi:hypothetical protein